MDTIVMRLEKKEWIAELTGLSRGGFRPGEKAGIISRRILHIAVVLILFASVPISWGCGKDPDPFPEKALKYQFYCGAGKDACYAGCGTKHDVNGNGTLDAGELPYFNSCAGDCDSKCDTSFLYLLLE